MPVNDCLLHSEVCAGVSPTRLDKGMLSHCFCSWITGSHYSCALNEHFCSPPCAGVSALTTSKCQTGLKILKPLGGCCWWTQRAIVGHIGCHVVSHWISVNMRLECSRKSYDNDNDVYRLKKHRHLWDLMMSSHCLLNYSLSLLS